MQKEIIVHNDKKVTKTIKNDGSVSYSQKSVYLGIDSKTGKQLAKRLGFAMWYACPLVH